MKRTDSAALPAAVGAGAFLGVVSGLYGARFFPSAKGLAFLLGLSVALVVWTLAWAIDNVRLSVLGEPPGGPRQPSYKPGEPVIFDGPATALGPQRGERGTVVDVRQLGPDAPDGWDVLVSWESSGVRAVGPKELQEPDGE